MARQILNDLGDAGVLSEVISEEGTTIGYQPGVDTDGMTIMYVIDAMEHYGSTALPITQSEDHKKIVASLKEFHKLIEESDANRLLKDI